MRLFRAGELTSIYVPTVEDEAIRDLVRCRDDIKRFEKKARQRLLSFLLRHGYRPYLLSGSKDYLKVFVIYPGRHKPDFARGIGGLWQEVKPNKLW